MLETFVVFIRDEVAIPFVGPKWEKYFGFLLSVFFFVLGLNLYGQIPFFGGSNVTGNLSVTLVLALLTFIITTVSGNAHYWKHLLVAPGIPLLVKFIIVPVEVMGMFIKPLTLMLRLFANITAGHIVMVVFIGFIFIFGKSGESVGGALGASVVRNFCLIKKRNTRQEVKSLCLIKKRNTRQEVKNLCLVKKRTQDKRLEPLSRKAEKHKTRG